MVFEGRLKALRTSQFREIEEIETQQEKKKIEAEKEEKMRAERLKKLEEIAAAQLSPILELVNEAYLEREGTVSSKGFLSGPESWNTSPAVRLELSWRGKEPSAPYVNTDDNKLLLELDHNLNVVLHGAGALSPTVSSSLNDKKWQRKLEEGVCSILSIPSACMWVDMSDFVDGNGD